MIRELMDKLPGFFDTDEGRQFFIRHGVRFGMAWDEVIRLERNNGFLPHRNDPESREPVYDSGHNYQLYYRDPMDMIFKDLAVHRFEYDFRREDKSLYQFYYVFCSRSDFMPLSIALTEKYGDMSADGALTERFKKTGTEDDPHQGWNLPAGDDSLIAVDLWMNGIGMCMLAYEQQSRQ